MQLTVCPVSERKEFNIFKELLRMVPGLEARIMESSEEDVMHIGELVRACDL